MNAFATMRRGLQARGLIDGEFGLTPAGQAYVDSLLVDLREAEAPPMDPAKRRVFWRLDLRNGHSPRPAAEGGGDV